jgi:hypothetical protein
MCIRCCERNYTHKLFTMQKVVHTVTCKRLCIELIGLVECSSMFDQCTVAVAIGGSEIRRRLLVLAPA